MFLCVLVQDVEQEEEGLILGRALWPSLVKPGLGVQHLCLPGAEGCISFSLVKKLTHEWSLLSCSCLQTQTH